MTNIRKFEIIATEDGNSAYLEVLGSKGNSYSVKINIKENEIIEWSCSCIFGSLYRFSERNVITNTTCRHIKQAISLLQYLGYLK